MGLTMVSARGILIRPLLERQSSRGGLPVPVAVVPVYIYAQGHANARQDPAKCRGVRAWSACAQRSAYGEPKVLRMQPCF